MAFILCGSALYVAITRMQNLIQSLQLAEAHAVPSGLVDHPGQCTLLI